MADELNISSNAIVISLDDGRTFNLRLLEFTEELGRLAREVTEQNGTHADYLQRVREYVQAEHGTSLSIDEADSLNDALRELLVKKKSERAARIAALLGSPLTSPGSMSAN